MAKKNLDALEQLRETTIVDDQVQAQLRKERVAGRKRKGNKRK